MTAVHALVSSAGPWFDGLGAEAFGDPSIGRPYPVDRRQPRSVRIRQTTCSPPRTVVLIPAARHALPSMETVELTWTNGPGGSSHPRLAGAADYSNVASVTSRSGGGDMIC